MRIRFFLTDITYRIADGKATIHLYGRSVEGQQVCIHDVFEPYFYVWPKDAETIKAELNDIRIKEANEYFVTNIEEVAKNVNEHPQRLLKVFVNLPAGVPAIKDAIRKSRSIVECYEYDIKFVRRYLIDKGLTPMTLIEAEGEPMAEHSHVPVLKAKSVKQASDDTLTKPRILAVDIETYNSGGKVQMDKDPILMLAVHGDNFEKVVTWKHFPTQNKSVEFVSSEADVLERFKQLVEEYKPDILVGYYSDGFDLPFIQTRAKKYRIKLDLGLDGSELSIEGRTQKSASITGIVHLDIFKFIRRIIGRSMQTDSFSLDAVAKELLGQGKHKVDLDNLSSAWDNTDPILDEFAYYNLKDAQLTYHLCDKVLPNMLEFVKIIGLPLWDVNRMTFSQFVEWFIIKQAALFNEVTLNRPNRHQEVGRMLARFKGAFVFEPTPGVYDDIVVYDYRSLYPSIMASHNISPGTLNCDCCKDTKKVPFEDATYWFCTKRRGFVSKIIEELITRRARIKEMIKKEQKKDPLLAARSEALKVLSNSFYGYLGFAPARWYSFECGQSVTAYARYYVNMAITAAQNDSYTVLYSDTDSVFLMLGKKTKEDAMHLVERINHTLPPLMELEYENYYPRGLFVATKGTEAGAKKKYALIDGKGNLKIRGFEMVRRNTSFIAKDIQKDVLQIILKEHDAAKAVSQVKQVISDLKTNKISVEKVVICTQITKDVSEYENISPHVAAAQRMKDAGQVVGSGTIVKYVVTKGKGKIRDRVKLETEAKQEEYDGDYYIEHQVLPAVERIFAVLGVSPDELEKKGQQKTLGGF